MRQRVDLPFPMPEFERRLSQLRTAMQHRAVDVLMVTVPENIFYLTGFETTGYASYGALFVPLDSEPFMVTRILEATGVEAFTWIERSRPYVDGYDPILRTREALEEFGLHRGRIGYERDSYFLTAPQQERLFAACPEARWSDCSGLVEGGRLIKSSLELDKIREAARYAEAAITAGIETAGAGVRDNELAAEMHRAMIRAGSDYPAVAPFVATGPRSAIGHATWTGRTLVAGDCVFLEPAGCKHRYHAAMMRTGFIGEPPPVVREAEKIIQDAVAASLELMKPGAVASEVDAASRSLIGRSTIGLQQLARSAYSIGIAFAPDWGEGGILSLHPQERRTLEPNMVFHLIPWALVPDRFAMGLSETVRITETGCEVITNLPRRIFVKDV